MTVLNYDTPLSEYLEMAASVGGSGPLADRVVPQTKWVMRASFFRGLAGDASLEEIFFAVTSDGGGEADQAPPAGGADDA